MRAGGGEVGGTAAQMLKAKKGGQHIGGRQGTAGTGQRRIPGNDGRRKFADQGQGQGQEGINSSDREFISLSDYFHTFFLINFQGARN